MAEFAVASNPVYYKFLQNLYQKYGCSEYFNSDFKYLSESIAQIEHLWEDSINKLTNVKLIILAEAPMWGDKERFFYNPEVGHSQFFYYSDLSGINQNVISSKKELIREFNNLGIVIIDFSPFPFNPEKTKLSYKSDKKGISKKISDQDYKKILIETSNEHFIRKLQIVKRKSGKEDMSKINFCFRYERVRKNTQSLILPIIKTAGFSTGNEITSISMDGGGVDRNKLVSTYFNRL